eukprot:184398_1
MAGIVVLINTMLYKLCSPLLNVINIVKETEHGPKPPEPIAIASLDLFGHFTSFFAAIRSFLIALFVVYVLDDETSYPAFADHISFSLNWMLPIIIRDLIGTVLICGSWDYILYFSPFAHKLKRFKYNKMYPSMQQIKHDIFWTLLASVNAAFIEIILCYAYSNEYLKYDSKSLLDNPIKNTLWIITITHWRVIHFWFIHRMIHPWKINGVPDIGKVLYVWVHSLHHKSINPTAFSGTSMHPIEAFLYYSACFCCLPFGCHPTIAIGCIMDCAVGAWLGHDGFQFPGSGDYFHQLHHEHFDCNYGGESVPIDKWL